MSDFKITLTPNDTDAKVHGKFLSDEDCSGLSLRRADYPESLGCKLEEAFDNGEQVYVEFTTCWPADRSVWIGELDDVDATGFLFTIT